MGKLALAAKVTHVRGGSQRARESFPRSLHPAPGVFFDCSVFLTRVMWACLLRTGELFVKPRAAPITSGRGFFYGMAACFSTSLSAR